MQKELEKNKIILVIGGTGFFGKSILDSFQKGLLQKFKISEVILMARNTSKFINDFPELIGNNVHLIKGDISVSENIPYADIVIHAASSTNKSDYIKNSANQKTNIEKATENYCALATRFHKSAKIVYCSSGAVYGQQPFNLEKIAENQLFQDVESLPIEKRDYATGKRNAENGIIELGKEGLSVSIARCFAFFGKYLPKDQHFAYGNFIGQAERGEDIIVTAKNPVYRSYMSADDLVDSLIMIALNSNQSCPIYNVGSDEAILIHDLAKKIAEDYGVKYKISKDLDWNLIDRYVPDCEKLKKLKTKSNI